MKNFFKSHLNRIWIIVCTLLNAVLVVANILGQTGLHDVFISALGKRNTEVFGSGVYYRSRKGI